MSDELKGIDARILSAWSALAGARAAASHSPNGETLALENMCERTVNELLERRHEMTSVGV